MVKKNYVLGRGRIKMANLDPATKEPGAYRYVGASRELNITLETESLEHTSSDAGVNEVDAQVQLSQTRSGTLILEEINPENLSLFLFGSVSDASQAAAGSQTDIINGARLSQILKEGYSADHEIIVGATAAKPEGARKITAPTLAGKNSANPAAAVTLAKGTDWDVVNLETGAIRLLKTAKTFDATGNAVLTEITVSYGQAALSNVKKVISGSTSIEVAIRYEENNPEGDNGLWIMPQVSITPSGEMSLKAEEWRQIPLSISVNKPANSDAILYFET